MSRLTHYTPFPSWSPKQLLALATKINSKMNQANTNKKSELMLIKCAKAYGSSCLQLILVYLHPFCCTSLFCSQKSHKVT